MTDTAEQPRVAIADTTASIAVALAVGGLLAMAATAGAPQLLVAVAAVQTLLAFAVVFGLGVPGWFGALVIAGLASSAADMVVSHWSHGRLGTLLAVFGLAVPVMFVHQLWRGAARVRLLDSLGTIAVLVLAEVGVSALLQVRHEFPGLVARAVLVVATVALVVSYLLDLVAAFPRLDRDVPRGLIAVLGASVAGGAAGLVAMRGSLEFAGGRGAFVGALLGALVAVFAIAMAFLQSGVAVAEAGFARHVRPALTVLLSLCLMAPVGFLLCSALRA